MIKSCIKVEFSNVDCLDASDGLSGLQIIYKEIPDLIILDVKMPSLDGIETLKEIRKHKNEAVSGIPVFMLTAQKDVETVSEAINSNPP